jgi:hypothetical protein
MCNGRAVALQDPNVFDPSAQFISKSPWGGGDGRAAFAGGSPLHRSQSGGREPCRGLACSSARPRKLAGEDDELATVAPLRALIPDFAALLAMPADAATTTRIERGPHHRPPAREAGMDRDAAQSREGSETTARQAQLL